MHQVVIAIFDGVQPLDVVGPHEVFVGANEALDRLGVDGERYSVALVAGRAGAIASESGLHLVAQQSFDTLGRVDTILVPGGITTRLGERHVELLQWLSEAAERDPKRVASVCTGTFLLAAAGVVTTERVTTHWAHAGELATQYPGLTVDPDPIYIRQGRLWTSVGVTAGIDLSLAMVEDDFGPAVAQLVARHLVVSLRRAGGQSQFSAPVWSESTEVEPIRRARDIIHATPEADLAVAALAASVGLSERHFTRLFRTEIGESPARYVDRVRVEAARSILESERVGLDVVAKRCGYSNPETLRRAFHRRLGVSPAEYRRKNTRVHTITEQERSKP